MQKISEFRGKTADDAVARALAELGLERDDVSVEIIERGKSGFLGFGAVEAVVRVTYEAAGEVSVPAETIPVPEKEKPARRSSPAPAADRAEDKAPAKTEVPAADTNKAAAQVRNNAEGEQAEQTARFLSGLLDHMGVHAAIDIAPREGGGLDVNLSGSGIGAVIGRRGETLDAIQHLTNYAVNRGSDKRAHINVDAENYRAKREDSLVRLAEKMAAKAIKYKRSMALEPMNSYERHVIHAALQNYEGVTTSSTGSEPNRRVVVSYVPAQTKKKDTEYKEWC